MSKFIDLTGMAFDRLKVIKYVGESKWLCECNCPKHNQVVVKGNNLKSGNTTSCGCKTKKYWEPINIDQYTYGIPLTKGHVAFIDKDDFDKVKDYAWWSDYDKVLDSFYAKGWIDGKNIRMHRLILNVPTNTIVDHKDHNTLNNKKNNLRLCTQSQNCQNKRMQSDNSTGYKGVYLEKKTNKYRSKIRINGKLKHLGYYSTAIEAYTAYKTVAEKIHGEFYYN
jgi:hypothetical protein